ncbi:AAA family ATPase, partial [Escherichia coli]|nr:AAA family ATPase [Escherichia coli]
MAEKKKKTITGQVLNSIKINKLKCINGLNEIIFKPHALTAILGPNGSGKSTILHAIASIYMPEKGFPGEDHRLMHFFPRGARRIRKKSYAKVFRASVRAETSRLPVCG